MQLEEAALAKTWVADAPASRYGQFAPHGITYSPRENAEANWAVVRRLFGAGGGKGKPRLFASIRPANPKSFH